MPTQKFVVPEIESPDDLLVYDSSIRDYALLDLFSDETFIFPTLLSALRALVLILRNTKIDAVSVYERTYNDLYFPHVRFSSYYYSYVVIDNEITLVDGEDNARSMVEDA